MSRSFIAIISTFLSFSIMRKQTWKFQMPIVLVLTEQPEDNLGLFFFEAAHI